MGDLLRFLLPTVCYCGCLSSFTKNKILLRMEFSYHTSYVMPELAVTTQAFCIASDFLHLGFWNRVMLLQDWSHHYSSFIVVIIDSWIVTVYLSAKCHSFPFLFRLPMDLTLYEQLGGCFKKVRGRLAYRCIWPMLPFFFSGVQVAHLLLLLCMYYFSRFMFFVVLVCFPCLVFIPRLHSFDFR